jgi:hypothetical protein
MCNHWVTGREGAGCMPSAFPRGATRSKEQDRLVYQFQSPLSSVGHSALLINRGCSQSLQFGPETQSSKGTPLCRAFQ